MKSKGARFERELIDMFWKRGFAAIRTPASGVSRHPIPDVVVGNGRIYFAIEVKMRSNLPVYLTKNEIEDLITFSKTFGAEPYVAVKLKRERWRFFKISMLIKTKKRFKIDETNFYQGLDFDELLGLKQVRITDF
jgi:Holliday junction resolvase